MHVMNQYKKKISRSMFLIIFFFILLFAPSIAFSQPCTYEWCGYDYVCHWRCDSWGCWEVCDYEYVCTTYPDTCRPGSPVLYSATAGVLTISLDWESKSDVTYNLYWSYSPGTNKDNFDGSIMGIAQSSYEHSDLVPGKTYYYVVTAEDSYGDESSISNEISATPIPLLTSLICFNLLY